MHLHLFYYKLITILIIQIKQKRYRKLSDREGRKQIRVDH